MKFNKKITFVFYEISFYSILINLFYKSQKFIILIKVFSLYTGIYKKFNNFNF